MLSNQTLVMKKTLLILSFITAFASVVEAQAVEAITIVRTGRFIRKGTQPIQINNTQSQKESLASAGGVELMGGGGAYYDEASLTEENIASISFDFKSFSAAKKDASTFLRWTMTSETNNKGFIIQRFSNKEWENIGFISSKAEKGNSRVSLNYTYEDDTNNKGAVEYRIMQVDMLGKTKFGPSSSVVAQP
jgi:hypothetical protein